MPDWDKFTPGKRKTKNSMQHTDNPNNNNELTTGVDESKEEAPATDESEDDTVSALPKITLATNTPKVTKRITPNNCPTTKSTITTKTITMAVLSANLKLLIAQLIDDSNERIVEALKEVTILTSESLHKTEDPVIDALK